MADDASAQEAVPSGPANEPSHWDTVREKANIKSQEEKIASRWYRPSYWAAVTEEEKCSWSMPLKTMLKVALKRAPLYTIIYCVVNIVMFNLDSGPEMPGKDGEMNGPAAQGDYAYLHTDHQQSEWYTPMTATVLHTNRDHITGNTILLALGGSLLEFSEGRSLMLALHVGAAPLGFAYHGSQKDSRVRGASGVIYAIIWAQLGLLTINWRTLRREKWIRLIFLTGLFAAELVAHNAQTSTSYETHFAAAVSGIAIGKISGKNVRVTNWEPFLIAAALLFFLGCSIGAFATEQAAAGCWSLVIVPKLLFDVAITFYRGRAKVRHAAASIGIDDEMAEVVDKFAPEA